MDRISVDGLTVDAERAKDLDDAFWVEKTDDEYHLTVSIADVASLVSIGSIHDETASGRGQTMYAGSTMKSGMLDSSLSRGMASLLPARQRNVIALQAAYSLDGELKRYQFNPAILTSRSRLSYEAYDSTFEQHVGPFAEMVKSATELARLLWTHRIRNAGKVDWDAAFDLNGNIRPAVELGVLGKTVVHEFMVTVNALSTEFIWKSGWPMIFRNQGPRPGGPSGRYEIVCYGHATNGTPRYGQFSSPIRRYTDLVNQRILSALLNGENCSYDAETLAEFCAHSNRTAQQADAMRRTDTEEASKENIDAEKTPVSRLDPIGFRRYLEFQALGNDVKPEIHRRVTGGLMQHRDLAIVIFGNNDFLPVSDRSDLIERLALSHDDFQRVWTEAVNIGFVQDVCSSIVENEDGWTALLSSEGQIVSQTAGDPVDARMAALKDISMGLIGQEPLEGASGSLNPIIITDDKAKWLLNNLCRVMDWEHPVYNIVSRGESGRPIYRCQATIGLTTFVYETPFVHSSSIKGAEMAAANLAFSALDPYAREVMKRDMNRYGIQLSCLTSEEASARPMTAVLDFCRLYDARSRVVWLRENSANDDKYVCKVELSADGKIIGSIGSGSSRIKAMESSARETIQKIVGAN